MMRAVWLINVLFIGEVHEKRAVHARTLDVATIEGDSFGQVSPLVTEIVQK